MIDLYFIGIGMGNPDHLTRQAIAELQTADVILIPHKGAQKSDLADLRKTICEKCLEPIPPLVYFNLPKRDSKTKTYLEGVVDWHSAIAKTWQDTLHRTLPNGGKAALMIWGDPSLYDSSLRIAQRLNPRKAAIRITVVPGLTSVQLLTAAHAIPLNALGAAVTYTTGRNLANHGWPDKCKSLVVMLDGQTAFDRLDPDAFEIWWGAFLGMPEQILISGRLSSCCEEIKITRQRARETHGWIMDTYLLRPVP
ncbi:precorrin-6A synthase (deacetylating) [Paracoccaceae bacterium]|nr:precorrin-6A synthase (deacetylating) [Paracoccaceae bacterium]